MPFSKKPSNLTFMFLRYFIFTFNPWALLRHEGVPHVPRHPRVGPSREDPRASRLGSLQKALSKAPLQPRLQLKVGLAAAHSDQELRLLQGPFPEEQGQDEVGPGVVRKADVLEK